MDEVVRIAARAYEKDRYLAALLAPRRVRADLIVLFAFAGEVARVASMVSEPMMGAIRLQWWRDQIESEAGASGHPISDAVRDLRRRCGLPAALLLGMVDAEEGQVVGAFHEDDQQLSAYLAKRDGALFALAWRVRAGAGAGAEPKELAEAGQIYGRTRILVELAALAAEGRMPLPLDALRSAGLGHEDVRVGADVPAALVEVLDGMRADVRRRLSLVKSSWKAFSPSLKDVLLPLALVEPYLSAQERLGADCLRHVAEIGPLRRVARLWLVHQRGRL
ncbi:MAG: hypothetical protein RLZ98_2994 [Pseudomonadota bacterium]|jgi:phytoene synthase